MMKCSRLPRWNLRWYRLLREKTTIPITLHIHLPYVDQGQRMHEAIEALSQGIVNKVLHAPTVKLRDSSRAGHGRRWVEVISELFGLGAKGRTGPGS